MNERLQALLDPTHPGLNVRDLASRGVHDAAHAAARANEDSITAWRPRRLRRHGMRRLHADLLRDLGLDRSAC